MLVPVRLRPIFRDRMISFSIVSHHHPRRNHGKSDASVAFVIIFLIRNHTPLLGLSVPPPSATLRRAVESRISRQHSLTWEPIQIAAQPDSRSFLTILRQHLPFVRLP
jgi:hypothetical protein